MTMLAGLGDLPVRMRELGRLRPGEKKVNAKGKSYPAARSTWRFTSQYREQLDAVAELYGGEVVAWPEAPGVGTFWQVGTDANSIEVLIPVAFSLSQHYEFWTQDGCTRRCNGTTNLVDDTPCVCPSDINERMEAAAGVKPTACKPTTRLNVMLPDVPDLGFWRVECHGYQGAIELPGALAMYVGLARQSAGPGMDVSGLIVRAELAIDRRTSKKPGKARSDYVVPVIRTPGMTPRMLMSGNDAPMSIGPVPGVTQIDAPGHAPVAIGTGSKRSVVVGPPAAPLDNPEFDVDPPDDAFTEADMVLVSADVRRAWAAECEEGGFDESVQAAIVHRATKGRTGVLKLVEKSEWDRLLASTQALIEGKLREAIVDGAVRLHAVEEAAVA